MRLQRLSQTEEFQAWKVCKHIQLFLLCSLSCSALSWKWPWCLLLSSALSWTMGELSDTVVSICCLAVIPGPSIGVEEWVQFKWQRLVFIWFTFSYIFPIFQKRSFYSNITLARRNFSEQPTYWSTQIHLQCTPLRLSKCSRPSQMSINGTGLEKKHKYVWVL